MPERDEIYRQLQKITESEIFSRSGINVRLLSILVEASLKGDNLKEASIGAELFGNRYDPVKNDTKVRVYIHNLRKKLDAYYSEEGLNDTLLFEIEKGRYRVLFSEKKTSSKKRKKAGIVGWILAVLVLIVSFLILLPDKQMPFFWNKYARSKFPVTVLIGDHFTINGPIATGGEGIFP